MRAQAVPKDGHGWHLEAWRTQICVGKKEAEQLFATLWFRHMATI